MGYQVGAACYADKRLAENVYFSQVVPVITDSGLKQINYFKDGWYIDGRKIEVRLPECNPVDNYKAGWELGISILPTALVLMSALMIIRLFK